MRNRTATLSASRHDILRIAQAGVGAFDRNHVGHAVAHERVAHVVFEIQAADAGNALESVDRPSDHADRLIKLVDQRRTSDVDIDRLRVADRQFGHLLGARHDHGVVAGGAGIEERDRAEAGEVVLRRSGHLGSRGSAVSAAADRSRRKAAVSKGSSTGTGLAAMLAKRSPVARLSSAIAPGTRPESGRSAPARGRPHPNRPASMRFVGSSSPARPRQQCSRRARGPLFRIRAT